MYYSSNRFDVGEVEGYRNLQENCSNDVVSGIKHLLEKKDLVRFIRIRRLDRGGEDDYGQEEMNETLTTT